MSKRRRRFDHWLRHHGHRRTADVLGARLHWWDWGHRLMALTGRDDHGSWGVPRPRDMWFRSKPGGGFETTYDYADVRDRNDGEWRIFDSQNDGFEIIIGWWPHDRGNIRQSGIYGRGEQALFRSWLIWECWVRAEWFGLRRWLYYRGLHAVVHERIPFTCQATPPAGSGGYDHWHCQLRPRRHKGPHRLRNYTWNGDRVAYEPAGGPS